MTEHVVSAEIRALLDSPVPLKAISTERALKAHEKDEAAYIEHLEQALSLHDSVRHAVATGVLLACYRW